MRSQKNTPKVKPMRRQGVQSRSFSVGSTGVQSQGGAEPLKNKDGTFNDTGARGLSAIQRKAGKCIAVIVKAVQNHKVQCEEVQIAVDGARLPNAPRALKFADDVVVLIHFRTLPRYSKVCAQVLNEESVVVATRECIVEDLDRFQGQEFAHKRMSDMVAAMVEEQSAQALREEASRGIHNIEGEDDSDQEVGE